MNKTIAAASVASVALVVGVTVSHIRHQNAVAARFPQIDPKVAKAAYRRMLKNAARGSYGDIAGLSDEAMDRLCMIEVRNINHGR